MGVTCLHKLLPLHLTQGQRTDTLCTDGLTRVAPNTLLLNMTGSPLLERGSLRERRKALQSCPMPQQGQGHRDTTGACLAEVSFHMYPPNRDEGGALGGQRGAEQHWGWGWRPGRPQALVGDGEAGKKRKWGNRKEEAQHRVIEKVARKGAALGPQHLPFLAPVQFPHPHPCSHLPPLPLGRTLVLASSQAQLPQTCHPPGHWAPSSASQLDPAANLRTIKTSIYEG